MKRIQPKRIISFRLDYELEKHLDSKPNTSKYLNSLIKEDYQPSQWGILEHIFTKYSRAVLSSN